MFGLVFVFDFLQWLDIGMFDCGRIYRNFAHSVFFAVSIGTAL